MDQEDNTNTNAGEETAAKPAVRKTVRKTKAASDAAEKPKTTRKPRAKKEAAEGEASDSPKPRTVHVRRVKMTPENATPARETQSEPAPAPAPAAPTAETMAPPAAATPESAPEPSPAPAKPEPVAPKQEAAPTPRPEQAPKPEANVVDYEDRPEVEAASLPPAPGFAVPETVGGNEGGNGRRKRRRNRNRRGNGEQQPQQQQQPREPRVAPEALFRCAWKIFLGEVTEEGLALMDDRTAREASARAFRVAEIFLQESGRRNATPTPSVPKAEPLPGNEDDDAEEDNDEEEEA